MRLQVNMPGIDNSILSGQNMVVVQFEMLYRKASRFYPEGM